VKPSVSGERLPVTVIGGFLGAGKTTLVNHLLRTTSGRRFAVLVNDFGAIDIDSRLIVAHGGRTVSLANGCVCCSIGDSLVMALADLLGRRADIDHVVIEASGIAEPDRIAGLASLDPALRLDGTLVLADASTLRERSADRFVGDTVLRQLAAADIILLNKIDLAAAEEVAALQRWIAESFAAARVLCCVKADLAIEMLFGLPAGAKPPVDAEPNPASHTNNFRQWCFSARQPLPRGALEQAITTLPPSVIRAKGFVDLIEAPQRRSLLQLVGRRHVIETGEPWGRSFRRSDIVFLGTPEMPDDEALAQVFSAMPK
jgi:G3E family GTPase